MSIETLVREFESALLQVREAHYEFWLHDRTSGQDVQDSLRVLTRISERMRDEVEREA